MITKLIIIMQSGIIIKRYKYLGITGGNMIRFTLGSVLLVGSFIVMVFLTEGCAKTSAVESSVTSSSMPTTISADAH